ncbi:MAG: hypothetical protein AAFR11_09190 [Pseudomonadota bacterium]
MSWSDKDKFWFETIRQFIFIVLLGFMGSLIIQDKVDDREDNRARLEKNFIVSAEYVEFVADCSIRAESVLDARGKADQDKYFKSNIRFQECLIGLFKSDFILSAYLGGGAKKEMKNIKSIISRINEKVTGELGTTENTLQNLTSVKSEITNLKKDLNEEVVSFVKIVSKEG